MADTNVIGDAKLARRVGASLGAHQQAEILCQGSFGLARIADIEFFGDHQSQHPVAQELQALIGRSERALAAAAMGKSRLDEVAIAKGVAEERRYRLVFLVGKARPVCGHGLNSRD